MGPRGCTGASATTATLIGRGPIGVEGLLMITPHFFESTAVSALTTSRVYALMGNVVLATPLRWNEYGLRPFISGGLGLLHASQQRRSRTCSGRRRASSATTSAAEPSGSSPIAPACASTSATSAASVAPTRPSPSAQCGSGTGPEPLAWCSRTEDAFRYGHTLAIILTDLTPRYGSPFRSPFTSDLLVVFDLSPSPCWRSFFVSTLIFPLP